MHHYWVKEAGDPQAIGEYFPTGDERNGVPWYRNQWRAQIAAKAEICCKPCAFELSAVAVRNGLVLSRETHGSSEEPSGKSTVKPCVVYGALVWGQHLAVNQESYSWVIGSLSERRPLYGVRSDDLSAPTLGWQAALFCAAGLRSPQSTWQPGRLSLLLNLLPSFDTTPRRLRHVMQDCSKCGLCYFLAVAAPARDS